MASPRQAWDDRFFLPALVPPQPLPRPPAFRARHGGPIRPGVDTQPPRSFATTRLLRARRRARRASDADGRAEEDIRPEAREKTAPAMTKRAKFGVKPQRKSSAENPSLRRKASKKASETKTELGAKVARPGSPPGRRHSVPTLRPSPEPSRIPGASPRYRDGTPALAGPTLAGRAEEAWNDPAEAQLGKTSIGSLAALHATRHPAGNNAELLKRSIDRAVHQAIAMTGDPAGPAAAMERLSLENGMDPGDRLSEYDPDSDGELLEAATRALRTSGDASEDSEANLVLDLDRIDADSRAAGHLAASYKLSDSGAFNIDGFEIRSSGLVARADALAGDFALSSQAPSPPSGAIQDSLVMMGLLGRGTSGTVYKALHVPSLRLVAVKEIPVFETGQRHQMVRELRTLYQNLAPLEEAEQKVDEGTGVTCENIVTFYDAYMAANECVVALVVEFMDGGSLQDIVATGGCQEEEVLANIAHQVLRGLTFLHARRRMHRDIKPSNLLINHSGRVKFCDFGLARDLDDTHAHAETFVGTYPYMSPERIAGESYTTSSDVWAFGLTMMTMALGRFPYDGSAADVHDYWSMLHALRDAPPPKLPPTFSANFESFLALCLRKDPQLRPSAVELLAHPFLANCQVGGRPDSAALEGSMTARHELNDICAVVRDYYSTLWEAQHREGWVPTVPGFHPKRLLRLANQLGLHYDTIRVAFRRLVRDLRGAMERIFGA